MRITPKTGMQTSFRSGRAFFLLLVTGFPLIVGCGEQQKVGAPQSISVVLRQARIALIKDQLEKAEQLALTVPADHDSFADAMLIAGEAATKADRPDDAIGYYQDAMKDGQTSPNRPLLCFSLAEIFLHQSRLSDAEELYQTAYDLQPGNLIVNERLAFLKSLTARRWDSLQHYSVLIRSGEADYRQLAIAADVTRAIEQPEFIAECLAENPDDPLVQLARAYELSEAGDPASIPLLSSIVEENRSLIAAQALLGRLLFEGDDQEAFLQWHQQLPDSASRDADIWLTRGLWAKKIGDPQVAAVCLTRALKLANTHREAAYALGQVLVNLKDENAQQTIDYADRLVRLTQKLDAILTSEGRNPVAMREATELLESLGRIWEACAWGVYARQAFPELYWPTRVVNEHRNKLTNELPMVVADASPVSDIAVTDFDFGQWLDQSAVEFKTRKATQRNEALVSRISFERRDLIQFQYHNADDPSTEGMRMFEQTGGGVGILDIDNDHWPDVYLPQGSEWKSGDRTPSPSDRFSDGLYRSNFLRGKASNRFKNVATIAVGSVTSFGQGCSVGDINNDGFDDLYVACVGQNLLFVGNGDGTFTRVDSIAGFSDDSWTVSVMICDLNADGWADLFDVNYVRGEDVFTKICNGKSCSPTVFQGAPNRIWVNQGDGTFQQMDLPTPQGDSKGMGVAAFIGKDPMRPNVFVANDQVANHLLENQPGDNEHNLTFADSALISGVAYNEDGTAMACMGIAVDDFDGNGLSDLFVTNFENESNTLYLQDVDSLFRDGTRASGLFADSLPMTGWGTQSLDADLDGRPDVVVANGHVDDYTSEGGPFRMKPQFFQQTTDRFQVLLPEQVGDWFGDEYLGRGLARVDWNRDGRPDFICSLINQPVAVLENTTDQSGHFVSFRLKATKSSRDAIGARVTLTSASGSSTRELYAGDGYMASNERIVTFGLGSDANLDHVQIHWPSGSSSRINTPLSDSVYTLVEGASTATRETVSTCHSVGVAVSEPEAAKD